MIQVLQNQICHRQFPLWKKLTDLDVGFYFFFYLLMFLFYIHIVTTLITSIFVISSLRPEIEFGFILFMNLGNLSIF